MPKHRVTEVSSPHPVSPEAVWVDSYAGSHDSRISDHEFHLFPPFVTSGGAEYDRVVVRFYMSPGGYTPYILDADSLPDEVVVSGPFADTPIANDLVGYIGALGYKVVPERTPSQPLPKNPVVPEPIVGTPNPPQGKTLLFGLTGADGNDFVLYDREDAERVNEAENILGVPLSEIDEAADSQIERLGQVLASLGLDKDGIPVADQAIEAITELMTAKAESAPARSPRGPVLTTEPLFPGACVQDFYGTCWESYGVDHWVAVGASGFTAEFEQIVEPVLMTVPSAQALSADDYQSLAARVSPKIRQLLVFAGPLPTSAVTALVAQVLQAVEARVMDTSEI